MQFSNDSGVIVKTLVSKFDSCQPKRFSNPTFKKNLFKLFDIIYKDIEKGEKYVDEKIISKCFQAKILSKKEMINPEGYNSHFFPLKIKKYIEENSCNQLVYSCPIAGHPIRIRIMLFNNEELEKLDSYVRFMYIWLYICYSYSSTKCANKLNIFLYLTPFKKLLPQRNTEILDTNHVNTAFTYQCSPEGEIVIYREEEWMKVFIHETFHSFGLDIDSHSEKEIKKSIKQIFPIDSEFAICEAYTETWARIINVAFNSYNSMKKGNGNRDDFNMYMFFSLQIERLFALEQINKILNFMGLNYQALYEKGETNAYLRKNLYREKSNVFAYYILCGLLMNNFYEFIMWCQNNNLHLIRYHRVQNNIKNFDNLINSLYKEDSLIKGLKCNIFAKKKNIVLLKTTRMSAIEIP